MKKHKIKRISAYIIDISFILLLVFLINNFLPNNNINKLKQELNSINELKIKNELKHEDYLDKYISLNYEIDKENILINTINVIIIIIYFIIIPYFTDGKTLGLKLFKLKIERNDKQLLSLNNLLIRSFIVTGLLYFLISLSFIYLLKDLNYFIFVTILGLSQIGLAIISLFMIIYKKDAKGLQDIWSNTYITQEKV